MSQFEFTGTGIISPRNRQHFCLKFVVKLSSKLLLKIIRMNNLATLHLRIFIGALLMCFAIPSFAQPNSAQSTDEDSTIVYPASYFTEFFPVSANDMLNRIPGIGLALRGGRGGRGLGAGEGEVLIDGQRITGKNNEGRDQLSRISADQVDYIEIIRGTSEELDIRSGGQVVNIVLLDTASRSSTTVELRTDRIQDGTLDPGGQFSVAGRDGIFNYIFNLEADPGYRYWDSKEYSYDNSGNLLETQKQESSRDENEYSTNMNIGFDLEKSVLQFSGLYEDTGKSPTERQREFFDFTTNETFKQSEEQNRTEKNWEVGGDYEYETNSRAKYRILFIANDRKFTYDSMRYDLKDDQQEPNLFLDRTGRDRERIVRTSYTKRFIESQGIELGIEGAQTIRDSTLKMGLDVPGSISKEFGNLVPVRVDNSTSTVEEIRYEPFTVHNWQINDRMSLESRVLYETSTIEQSGDIRNKREFSFIKPKLDYRYNITQSLQLRFEVEKDISQLSFSDFSASIDSGDEEKNTRAGNPEITQEKIWRYDLNLEYRLPNDLGVLNSQLYYRDVRDHIDRVDVSTSPDNLQSARGNIGDGKYYGVNFDVSTKLDPINISNALFTTRVRIRDSEFTDPFLGVKRRRRGNGRWEINMGFRHDITSQQLTYGFNYNNNSNDGEGRKEFDIDDIEERIQQPSLSAYIEKKAFGNLTFRFESRNITENQWCRTRTRFSGHISEGQIREIEDYCSSNGMELALKVRTTF